MFLFSIVIFYFFLNFFFIHLFYLFFYFFYKMNCDSKKNNDNDFLDSYITLKEILKPNLSERKNKVLDLFINILIGQINSYTSFIFPNENQNIKNLVQENILMLSKELSKILSFTKENKPILIYNNIINFSIQSSEKNNSTSFESNNNKNSQTNKTNSRLLSPLHTNKKNTIKKNNNNDINNLQLKTQTQIQRKSLNNNLKLNIKERNNNNQIESKTSLTKSTSKLTSYKLSVYNKKNLKKEDKRQIRNNSMNDINSNSKDYKNNNKMSLNSSIEKLNFSTITNNNNNYKTENKTKSKKVNKEIIVNNPKIGIKAYEEITNRPSNYTKYLFEKYKDVVDNYEKEKINSKNNSVTKLIKKKNNI